MPAKSKKQQRFFGMVHARQKGKNVGGPDVEKVAKEIDVNDAEDFASTKHKGLPEKVEKKDESTSFWEQFKARHELQKEQKLKESGISKFGGASLASVRFSPEGQLELFNRASQKTIVIQLTPEQLQTVSHEWYSFVSS